MATAPKSPGPGAAVTRDSAVMRARVPKSISVAAILLVLAAAAQVIASVIAVIYATTPERMAVIQQEIDTMTGSVPSVESIRNMGVITVVLAGLGTVVAYVLLAFFIRKGRTWARTGATVLLALTLVQLLGITFPLGLTTIAQLSLGAMAVVLCHAPGAKEYFLAVKKAAK